MPQYTAEEYATLLTRTYAPLFAANNRPRIVTDVSDQGAEILELILPHPQNGRFSVCLQASTLHGSVSSCALRFGQAEVASHLEPDEALSAINEVIENRIVAVVRYRNRNAYDNCRKASTSPSEWLYQTPDDEDSLAALMKKLKKPATFFEKVSGKYTGVFEVYRWSKSEIIER